MSDLPSLRRAPPDFRQMLFEDNVRFEADYICRAWPHFKRPDCDKIEHCCHCRLNHMYVLTFHYGWRPSSVTVYDEHEMTWEHWCNIQVALNRNVDRSQRDDEVLRRIKDEPYKQKKEQDRIFEDAVHNREPPGIITGKQIFDMKTGTMTGDFSGSNR